VSYRYGPVAVYVTGRGRIPGCLSLDICFTFSVFCELFCLWHPESNQGRSREVACTV
jgi:hypothetical protein